jgi:hypothetical protein
MRRVYRRNLSTRIKGTEFPLVDSHPALIDPSTDNPWDFLDFDPQTGNIVARYDPASKQFLLKGAETVRVLELDRREAMARGYQRTFRRIKRVVEDALAAPQHDTAALLQSLSEADDHGLLGWCFDGLGSHMPPFSDLQKSHPDIWHACCEHYRHH